MLKKIPKVVGACFAGMLFVLMVACSANNTATTLQKSAVTKAVDDKTARTFDCRNAKEYTFVVVENLNRKKIQTLLFPKI